MSTYTWNDYKKLHKFYTSSLNSTIALCRSSLNRTHLEFRFCALDSLERELMERRDQLRITENKRPMYALVYDSIMRCKDLNTGN